ncbi:MAG: hypothetical protein C0424_07395 [Sphingobacteriaceae bacterium]|nr:hypothetical protein [Sphingobacteriaceae bacterium]
MLKKILLVIGGLIFILLAAAIVLPIVYKDKIKALLVEEVNTNLRATVSLGDVGLNLFRSFPNFSLTVDNFVVANHAPFEGDTLANIGKFRFEIDLLSVLGGGDLEIKSISMADARLHLRMLADESVNWDITIPDTTAVEQLPEEPSQFAFAIQKYALENVDIIYEDDYFKQSAQLLGVNHKGSGDFTQDDFVLKTFTEVASFSYAFEGVRYISKAKGKFDVPIAINMPAFSFTFTENDLYLNELNLKFAGVVAMPADDISMDLTFNTPQSDFRALLSVVPGMFNEYFKDIKTSGKFVFDGKMKGVYNDTSMPAFDFKLLVDKGYFQYPALPAAVKNINMDLAIVNPNGDLDATTVNLKDLSMDLGGNPMQLKLFSSTPMSDPFVEASFKGALDLAEVKNWYPVDAVKSLKGQFSGDLTARGNMSAIDQQRYTDFTLDGSMTLRDFYTVYEGIEQGIQVKEASMKFSPRFVELVNFDLQMGSSDLVAKGRIDNMVTYYFNRDVLKGSFLMKSNLLHLNELMGSSESSTPDEPATESAALEVVEIPGNIDFAVMADFKRVLYDNMEISQMQGNLILRDQTLGFRDVNMGVLGGTIQMSGTYDTRKPGKPVFDFNLGMQQFSVQETFKTFVTMQKVAPIGQYTSGTFSTGFGIKGDLQQDMTPDLNSLNGGGLMKIPNATISGFKPLEKLAEVTKMQNLNRMEVKNVDLSFEFEEGRVFIQPFEVLYQDMKLTIFGSNGFDQSIDYTINMEVPRAKLGAANTLMQSLSKQAAARGVNLELSPNVNIKVKMTGTVTDPKVSADLAEMTSGAAGNLKQQALDELDRKKKELEDKAKAEAERLKQELDAKKRQTEQKAKDELAKKRQQAQAEADRLISQAEQQATRLRAEGKSAADVIRKQSNETADKLIRDAGSNPVKKLAAEKAAQQIRKEGEQKAQRTEQEANQRADQLLAEARRRADALLNP